jgi:PAS domain S-box-containing protein
VRPFGFRGVRATIALVALATIALVVFSNDRTARAIEHSRIRSEAVHRIETNVAKSHVWLEEGIAGDETIDFERDVLPLISGEVGRCATLIGGRGSVPGLTGRDRAAARTLCNQLRAFHGLTLERWRYRSQGRAGSPADQAYDAAFDRTLWLTNELQERIRQSVRETRTGLRYASALIVALILALIGAMALIVRRRTRQLERLAHRNELVLSSAGDGIYGLDREGRAQFVNRAAAKMTGHEPEELVGRRLTPLIRDSRFDSAYESPVIASISERRTYTGADVYRRKDGITFPVEFTSTPIEEAGAVVGAVVVFRDISERLAAERAKDDFVATVSHELRTPLTSIQGYVEMLLEGEAGELAEGQRGFLEVVRRNSGRLQDLVADLLFVAQADGGVLTLQPAELDLAELVRESAASVAPAAADKEVEVTQSLGAVPPIVGDRHRLRQVMDNLLSNALKFTPAGGTIDVRAFAAGRQAVLEVADTGMGMSPEDQARVYERFYRTAEAQRMALQGTGLGLAIAKAIVDAHGGEIRVESVEGEGTTFRVELPLKLAAERADTRTEPLEVVG